MGPLKSSAQVLAKIAELLMSQVSRRIKFAEIGVFIGNTSEELIQLAPDCIEEAHLVDPWDGNGEFVAMAGLVKTPWPIQNGNAYMREVRRKVQTSRGAL